MKIISKEGFTDLVNAMIQDSSRRVVGVKAKGSKFAFDDLKNAGELRLDYDVTLLPPKKYFFPQRETLISFDHATGSVKGEVSADPLVLIGVHPYDIVAMNQMDVVFGETNADPYYVKKRENAIVIGSNIQNASEWCFAGSMRADKVDSGYDLFLTDLGDKFAIDVGTSKGEEVLSSAFGLRDATPDEEAAASAAQGVEFEQSLSYSAELTPNILKENYNNGEFWEDKAETCLKCGSCVLVCPTCYCFDVRDENTLDLQAGERYRTWDGCLLEGFAEVAGGENFREDKASRYRHRFYKKGQYLFDRLGFAACVGCGRCSSQCLPDIANPTTIFNELYTATTASGKSIEAATPGATPAMAGDEQTYVPQMATILAKKPMGTLEMLFTLKLDDGSDLGHQPGQFVEVSVLGIGEAPISVTSAPSHTGTFQLCVRKIGDVTNALHKLEVGGKVGIRGPFGTGFDTEFLKGKKLLFIAGGLGIAPLRSMFNYVLNNRDDFDEVTILYGCKEPGEMLFTNEVAGWHNRDDIVHRLTVDSCTEGDDWNDNVGVITTLIPGVDIDIENTWCIVVGPPIMYRFVMRSLKEKNVPDDHIIVSLERRMKCGLGKCGHCQMNGVYVCQEGPVFNYADIVNLPEALE